MDWSVTSFLASILIAALTPPVAPVGQAGQTVASGLPVTLASVEPSEIASPPDPDPRDAVYSGSRLELSVDPVLVESGTIDIDGRLSEPAWASAPLLVGFSEYEPNEGLPAGQETHARVLIGDDAIYFAIRASDESGEIRASLTERDGFGGSDDRIRILLDTFNDGRRAYVFAVNPFGVQADGLWIEGRGGRGGPIDWNPDFVWESSGSSDDGGYSIEIKVPFKSLRFPSDDSQDWGLQVLRSVPRTGSESSWAPISRDATNRLSQSGAIRGLSGLDPGVFLEVNPTSTGSWQGEWNEQAGAFERGAAKAEFGLNAAYGITSDLTLDATINPDFSQVEADAGQIRVNERFAQFFPEKRPFFLEGTDVFSTPRQLVYTRSIGNPSAAAKISGKIGPFSLAYLVAADESYTGRNPMVNLLRVRRDIGSSSSMGLLYTDRTASGRDFNRVFGVDTRLVLGGRYAIEILAAGSADQAPGDDSGRLGSLLSVDFERADRNVDLQASFEDIAPDFRARSGFIRRVGITSLRGQTGYTFIGSRESTVQSWGPFVESQAIWERDAFWSGRSPLEWEIETGLRLSFRSNIGGFVSYRRSAFSIGPESYERYFTVAADGALESLRADSGSFDALDRVSLRSWINTWERVRLGAALTWQETPIFARGVPVDVGTNWSADVDLTFTPTSPLEVGLGVRRSVIHRKQDGARYSSATIPRFEARYQFSRALFIRGLTEYASQSRTGILDPENGRAVTYCSSGAACAPLTGSNDFDFRIEGLLGYEPTPGTVVFFGYSRSMRDTESFGFTDLRSESDGLFIKLSYRSRL